MRPRQAMLMAAALLLAGVARAEHPVRVYDVPKGAHPHDVAPGPPVPTAMATPAMLPNPTVAERAEASA